MREASTTGTLAGIVMDSRFLSYGKEKKKAEAGLDPLPLWVCERNVVVKEKLLSHMDEAMPEVRQ